MKLQTLTGLKKRLQTALHTIEQQEKKVAEISEKLDEISSKVNHIDKVSLPDLEKLRNEHNSLLQRYVDLEHRFSLSQREQKKANGTKSSDKSGSTDLFANNHDLDNFYIEFENLYRGTEKEIRDKQTPYLKFFKGKSIDYKKKPVIDIGSGRGEFVQLLKKNGIRGVGVDLSEAMTQSALDKGLEAINDDAIAYIANQKSNSVGGVIGFHIAEHIPFEDLMYLIGESYRVLVKGGSLVLQTPNPESLYVGAYTFHFDPSHLKPIPPALMHFMAKYKGFDEVDIERSAPLLSTEEIKKISKNPHIVDMAEKIYGPRDYSLVATK